MSNTLRIAAACRYELPSQLQALPQYPAPDGMSAQTFLAALCRGSDRYRPHMKMRLQHELDIIETTGLALTAAAGQWQNATASKRHPCYNAGSQRLQAKGGALPRFTLPAIILLGLALRIAYTASVYGPMLDLDYPGDYWDYHIAAKQILRGDTAFTHRIFLVRPPLYPLIVAALGVNRPLLLILNQLLAIMIIPLTYRLARQLGLSVKLALLAALIVALDPTSIKYSGILLAEPLANLLLAMAFVALLALKRMETGPGTISWGLVAGALIALSALTRPAAYLLWIPLAAWIVGARWRMGLRGLAALAIALPALFSMGLWQHHNAANFNNSSFTSVGAFNLLYYRAASTLHLAQDRQDIEAVKASLARRVEAHAGNQDGDIPVDWRERHRANSGRGDAAMRDVALEVIRQHPAEFALAALVGAYQSLIDIWGALAVPGTLWNIALLFAAAVGLLSLFRRRRWVEAMFLLLPSVYFVAGTVLVCTTCMDTRARVMITPLLAVLAAYGIMRILNRRRAGSAFLSPPVDS